jgi:hypothetical protein
MQSYTLYLYPETALHVSGGTSTHHQERIQLYLQHLVFVTTLLLSAAIAEELQPVWVCWIYIGILLGAHPILHISRIKVKSYWNKPKITFFFLWTALRSWNLALLLHFLSHPAYPIVLRFYCISSAFDTKSLNKNIKTMDFDVICILWCEGLKFDWDRLSRINVLMTLL